MNEAFLHHVWRLRNFDLSDLRTTDGQALVVLQPGTYNTNAGPDFLNARVQIGETYWAGHIEVHLKASDWTAHGHTSDSAYENVVLHVVYEADKTITANHTLPTLELKDRIPKGMLEAYQSLSGSLQSIACAAHLDTVRPVVKELWLERMVVERIEQKAFRIAEDLHTTHNDWHEALYRLLCRNMGFKVNTPAFEALSESLPWKIILHHYRDRMQTEALLFGQGGFLDETFEDEYFTKIRKEYLFLKQKYNLTPIGRHQFKYLRLRPANFPTIRLSQLAELLFDAGNLLEQILSLKDITQAREFFTASASAYWQMHSQPGKPVNKPLPVTIAQSSADILIANVLVPFLFAYGILRDKLLYRERALAFLEALPAEDNQTTRLWENSGIENNSAFRSQGLMHMHRQYCENRRCLDCGIGTAILKK